MLTTVGVFGLVTTGLNIQPVNAATFTPITNGDIIASLANGQVNEYSPGGILVQTLIPNANTPTGSAFDGAGNLYVTEFGANDILKVNGQTGAVSVFSNDSILADATSFNSPESIAFGPGYTKMYVSDAKRSSADGGIHVIDTATGKGLGFYALPNSHGGAPGFGESDWLAFDASATLYMTDENETQGVMQVNQSSGDIVQPSFVANLPATGFAIAFDQSGDLWLSDTSSILEYSPAGTLIRTITNSSFSSMFSAAFNPSFNTLYAGDFTTGNIFAYDLSGNLQHTFNVGSGVDGLSVAGTVIVPSGESAPRISSVCQGSGSAQCANNEAWAPYTGGTTITINGSNFGTSPSVEFADSCPLSSFYDNFGKVISSNANQIVVSTPSATNIGRPDALTNVAQNNGPACLRVATSFGVVTTSFTYVVPQIGRLVFHNGSPNPDGPYAECTAEAVQSGNQRVILTAGHCVDPGYNDFAFAPGYFGSLCSDGKGNAPDGASSAFNCGTAPYGIWCVKSSATSDPGCGNTSGTTKRVPTFTKNPNTEDFGFIVTTPKNGVTLGQKIGGGLPITFNVGPNADQSWNILAYNENNGYLDTCYAPSTFDYGIGATKLFSGTGNPAAVLQIANGGDRDCSFVVGGGSGGPWINGQNGTSYGIGADNDTANLNGPNGTNPMGQVTGAYMGREAHALFNSVQNLH
ncbi:hypothetical protein ACX801_08040 [Arthrobacter bambusae]